MKLARRALPLIPYRLRPWLRRIPLADRVAARSFPRGEPELVGVRGGPLNGLRLELDLGTEKAFWAGTYEPGVQRALTEAVEDGMLAWDLGAYIGFFSLLLARRCRLVVAVEPNPDSASRLRRHVELNGLPVEVVEAAVWRHPGSVRLQLLSQPSRDRVWAGEAARAIEVRAITLSELAEAHGQPDLVKMDVEGAELEALAGAGHALDAASVVIVEAHEGRAGAVRQALGELGFTVSELDRAGRLLARRAGS